MKVWLCLTPAHFQMAGVPITPPPESLAILALYKTKKQGRLIHGPKAQFIEMEWSGEKK